MAGKLIPLAEAAAILGVSTDELTEMRSRGEIHGYRDGGSWKFKDSELDRVAAELGGKGAGASSEDSISALDDGESTFEGDLGDLVDFDGGKDDSLEGSSILVSDASRLKGSGIGSSIIGGDNAKADGDSDIKLASDSDVNLDEGSDLKLASSGVGLDEGGSGSHSGDSDVSLAADEQGSDVKLVPGDSGSFAASDSDFVTDSDVLAEDSGEQRVSTGDTGRLSDSDLALSEDEDAMEIASGDSLALGDDDLLLDEGSKSSSAGSALDLDDDDMVLGGSGIGSDVTLGTGDSGIGLANPSESGLDLEDATLDLGGSAVDSLELPEDDDDVIALDHEADPDAATQLKADDEFILTPVEGDDEEDESGSQVIALEDSAGYDADAATMLGVEAQPLVAEDSDMFQQQLMSQQAGGTAQPMSMPMPAYMGPAGPPEASYSIFNVLSLFFVMVFLLFTGLMMIDVVNNMWEFHEVGDASTSIMDLIVSTLGLDK
jgi:excisionase family DNA binding protein